MVDSSNLTSVKARDVMAKRLVTVGPQQDVAEGVHALLKQGVSGVPVVDGEGRYVGVFSEKCCMRVLTGVASLVDDSTAAPPRAREFMTRKLFALRPNVDVMTAIGTLLRNRVSGAPVTKDDGTFLGSFSEKTSMKALIDSVYDQVPSGEVGAFMDVDTGRVIDESTDLLSVARMFLETPFRRLPIVREGRVLGQISRRDVLRSSRILETIIRHAVGDDQNIGGGGAESMVLMKAHDSLPSSDIASFMDTEARTIDEETDLLAIATIFLQTPYRRLPVLRDGKVVGQVSRRDVLDAAYRATAPAQPSESGILYLSAKLDRSEMPSM